MKMSLNGSVNIYLIKISFTFVRFFLNGSA